MSKEHEALGPAAARARGGLPVGLDDEAPFVAEPSMTAEDRRPERRGAGRASDDRYLSQETVELDMRAVLDADASMAVGHAARDGVRSMTSAAPARALR